MIVYPVIATAVGFDAQMSGVFLGGTIHDVAQVVGAGYSMSPQTGDVATYVKLLRVALLLPTVLSLSLFWRAKGGAGVRAPFPLFLLGFVALVIAGSLGLLPHPVAEGMGVVSRWCLVAAVAALGMKTSFGALAKVGWRPVTLIVCETLWIGGLVLFATWVWR